MENEKINETNETNEKEKRIKVTVTIRPGTLSFINWFCREYGETKSGLIEKYFGQLKKKYYSEHSVLTDLSNKFFGEKNFKIDVTNKERIGHE